MSRSSSATDEWYHRQDKWGDLHVRLYNQPRSPYLFFDTYIEGKRHRISTKETTVRAAEKVAKDYLFKMGAGDAGRRSLKTPTLQAFSERFFYLGG
jgi:hypothetical protein